MHLDSQQMSRKQLLIISTTECTDSTVDHFIPELVERPGATAPVENAWLQQSQLISNCPQRTSATTVGLERLRPSWLTVAASALLLVSISVVLSQSQWMLAKSQRDAAERFHDSQWSFSDAATKPYATWMDDSRASSMVSSGRADVGVGVQVVAPVSCSHSNSGASSNRKCLTT